MGDREQRDQQGEDEEKEEQGGISINIGGGVGGDVKTAGGDLVDTGGGDVVYGHKTTVGDVIGSKGVAIGPDAQSTVYEGVDAAKLEAAFAEILARLDELETKGAASQDVADAKDEVEEIKTEAAKGEEADETFLEKRLRNIARMGPDILEVVTATLANPGAGVAMIVKKVAAKAREEAGLDPV